MRKLLPLISSLFVLSTFISGNAQICYKDFYKPGLSKIVYFKLIGAQENIETARYITNLIYKNDIVYFTNVRFTGSGFAIIASDLDFGELKLELLKKNIEITEYYYRDYDDITYLKLYIQAGSEHIKQDPLQPLNYVKIGNRKKDNAAYAKAKEIYLKENNN